MVPPTSDLNSLTVIQDSGSRTLIFEPEFEEVVSSIRSRLNFSDANDVQFIEELPKTASGKIQKFVLKKWHNTAKP